MDWKKEAPEVYENMTKPSSGFAYAERLAEYEKEKRSLERGERGLALYFSFYVGLCVGCILSAFAFLVFL